MKFFQNALRFLDRKTMSPSVKIVLGEESIHGMNVSNRLRYMVIVLFMINIAIFWKDPGTIYSIFTLMVFALITVFHTYLLKKRSYKQAEMFNYFVLISDYALILVLILIFTALAGKGSYTFAVKNNTFWIMLPLLMLQIPQLKIRLVWLSFFIMVGVQYGLVVAMLNDSPKLTNDWYENLMSEKINVVDAIVNRPLVIFAVVLIVSYGIYRAIYMVRHLGEVQHEKSMLSRYFSPQIIEEITNNPDDFKGRQQKATILFADIRGFTQLSEQISPIELVSFLSEFRERMSHVIFEMGG